MKERWGRIMDSSLSTLISWVILAALIYVVYQLTGKNIGKCIIFALLYIFAPILITFVLALLGVTTGSGIVAIISTLLGLLLGYAAPFIYLYKCYKESKSGGGQNS